MNRPQLPHAPRACQLIGRWTDRHARAHRPVADERSTDVRAGRDGEDGARSGVGERIASASGPRVRASKPRPSVVYQIYRSEEDERPEDLHDHRQLAGGVNLRHGQAGPQAAAAIEGDAGVVRPDGRRTQSGSRGYGSVRSQTPRAHRVARTGCADRASHVVQSATKIRLVFR